MLDAADLAQFQQDAFGALTGTCTILRKTAVTDWGGDTETWAPVASNVPCSVVGVQIGQSEANQEGRVTAIGSYVINVPVTTPVTERDRIQTQATLGGPILTNTYEVISKQADPASLALTLPLLCREVT